MEDLTRRLEIEYKHVGMLDERFQAYCVIENTSQAKGNTIHEYSVTCNDAWNGNKCSDKNARTQDERSRNEDAAFLIRQD